MRKEPAADIEKDWYRTPTIPRILGTMLPTEPSDEDILQGIRTWLELLANDEYPAAMKAVCFRSPETADSFKTRVEGFFGANRSARVARPTEEILRRSEIHRAGIPADCRAVVGFFIPLLNGLGIWTTFLIRSQSGGAFFEFEILHL
ncbi:MAG: hypothetical protein ACHRHE_12700 [Tepidisphaerales bacterium]